MVVGTPAGVSLAPEGGAHQSVVTPLVGMGMDRLTAFEPAFVDELAEMMAWGFRHMQAPDGESIYLRLSTRSLPQPRRTMTPEDAIRRAPADKVTLMIAGSSSGDRPTARATANRRESIAGRCISRLIVNTASTITIMTRVSR